MTRPAPLALILALAWAFAAALDSRAAQPPYRYRREFRVSSPGWVRVTVPLAVRARLTASGGDLSVRDPKGTPLPLFPWEEPPETPASSRMVPLSEMETVPGGWRLTADLGDEPARHRRVLFDLPGSGLAEGILLEGSADRESWRLLAKGAIFRLLPQGNTSKTSIEYAPSGDRYLRIFWPEEAGFPRWESLWVQDWPDRTEPGWAGEPVEPQERVVNGPGETRYRLAPLKGRLEDATLLVKMELPYPIRASLFSAREGRWRAVAETVFFPGGKAAICVPPEALAGPGELVLSAGDYGLPSVQGFEMECRPRRGVFLAGYQGTYTLWYGAAGRAEEQKAAPVLETAPESYQDAQLGPELEQPLPDLPSSSLSAGAALPDLAFAGRWAVAPPPSVEGGQIVGLELPAGLYAAARHDLGDVRLASGGRQIPFVLSTPPDGIQVLAKRGVSPSPSQTERGLSLLPLSLAASRLPLTEVELSVPAAPFTRRVSLQVLQKAPPGDKRRGEFWDEMASSSWSCPGTSDLPSRLAVHAERVEETELRLAFGDGDNAPLQDLDVTVWRRRHILLFPWPEGGEVELLAGAPTLSAPVYDIQALREELLSRPYLKAEASSPQSGRPPARFPTAVLRWALLGALMGAALLLLAILGRTLGRKEAGGTQRD